MKNSSFSQCVLDIKCGDGILDGQEQCDDGNLDNFTITSCCNMGSF